MKLQLRRKAKMVTAEGVIAAGLRQAYAMYPARMLPSTIIGALAAAGFVILSEADLDAEIALAFHAGQEDRDQ